MECNPAARLTQLSEELKYFYLHPPSPVFSLFNKHDLNALYVRHSAGHFEDYDAMWGHLGVSILMCAPLKRLATPERSFVYKTLSLQLAVIFKVLLNHGMNNCMSSFILPKVNQKIREWQDSGFRYLSIEDHARFSESSISWKLGRLLGRWSGCPGSLSFRVFPSLPQMPDPQGLTLQKTVVGPSKPNFFLLFRPTE